MFAHRTPALRVGLVACWLIAASACSDGKDKLLAKQEREAIGKRLTDSFMLVPYRGLKTMVRSAATNQRPPALDAVVKQLDDANSRLNAALAKNEVPLGPALELLVGAYRARAVLTQYDEDTFALLWTAWTKSPPPVAFYDAGAEHLLLGTTWIVVALLDRSGQVPAPEVIFYELSRVDTKGSWPWPMRVAGRALRGMAQCETGYHYAAEEELNALVDEVEHASAADRALIAFGVADATIDAQLRAAAHFARAWNRFGLNRRDKAIDDLSIALQQLQRAGIDNEVTQWATALVLTSQGHNEDAARVLDKLGASINLSADASTDIRGAATSVRAAGKDYLPLTSSRSLASITNALITRVGGMEALLTSLFGKGFAQQLLAPLNWVRALERSTDADDMLDEKRLAAAADNLKTEGKALYDRAGDAAAQGIDKAKELGNAGKRLLDKWR